ncbi:hypothetical protein [Candidatus Halobonum tyrrellensis]|uniref:Uncharacterized protein n=1 Tax=Candidatus Halobonum tyrrellensis G22 TaxID=1324957 RepID=V4IXF5_9EURY|nr:hypothetical protein [Candidatus Halobonum tyrrellensis]ESP87832.1 hypothetical protein K933_12191 [Candidatus Halobonum tyrrellensis G22]
MDEPTNSNGSGLGRRTAVKALGVGLVGAVGGVGALAGSAAAQVGATFTKSNPKKVVNADGRVTRYDVAVTGTFSYESFDDPAREADITLEGSIGSGWEAVSETTVEGLTNTQGTYDFSLAPTDVTEVFGDDAFSVDQDGGTGSSELQLRLTVEVTDAAGEEFSAEAENTMGLAVRNLESDVGMDAEADGSAGGYDSHYASPENQEPKNPDKGIVTKGAMDLFIDYRFDGTALSSVVYDVVLDEPWSDETVDAANMALGLAVDGHAAQIIWESGDGFHMEYAKNGSWNEMSIPEFISVSKEGTNLRVEVDLTGRNVLEAGDSYEFVANASYGGGGEHVTISNADDGKTAWDSSDWTATTYFLTEEVPEAGE